MKKGSKEIRIECELTDLPITALGGLSVVIEVAKALGIDRRGAVPGPDPH